jgi:hypothetical protein
MDEQFHFVIFTNGLKNIHNIQLKSNNKISLDAKEENKSNMAIF